MAGTKKKRSRMSLQANEPLVKAVATARALVSELNTDKGGKKRDLARLWVDEPDLLSVRDWIPTGFHWFDWMLSNGKGLPVGRAIQLWGKPSACKSTFAQYLVTPFQKRNGVALYIDFEYALDAGWLRGYNVNASQFVQADPETVEEAFELIFNSLKVSKTTKDTPLLIVWDSVAQALPQAERDEKSFGDRHIAPLPRAFSKGCRRLPRKLSRRDATIIFINQTRTKMGASKYEDPDMRPGGQAIDFASTAIIKMRGAKLKKKVRGRDVTWGYQVTLFTNKNRMAPPFRSAEIIVDFANGPNEVLSNYHFLKRAGLVVAAGSSGQKIKGNKRSFKSDDWSEFMGANPKLIEAANNRALEKMSAE